MTGLQLTQGIRRSADLFPERPATIAGDRQTNWGQTRDRVARLAAGLRDLGAQPGDRIAVLALNSDLYIEAYYAILWAGCVGVPLNTRWVVPEICQAMEDCEPSLLLIDRHFMSMAPELMRFCPMVVMEAEWDGAQTTEGMIASHESMPDESGSGDNLAMIFFTGGTTGRSKGVMLSHANLLGNFFSQQSLLQYPSDTRFLHVAPMFHMADACCVFGITAIGGTHVVLPGFVPRDVIDTIERRRISTAMLVPTMIGMLVEELASGGGDVASVRNIFYGASPISEVVLREAMDCFPNARFAQGYGQTELSPVATLLEHEDHLRGYLRAAGRPIPNVDIRVVDTEMRDRPGGEVGEVVVRGPGVMLGYWRQPELTQATVVDGWLRTGDAGYRDAQGYLFLVDRVKDMIISGGENIYSAEVENALMTHPAVLQCAVIGLPDENWGERVHAVIQLRPEAEAAQEPIAAHVKTLIAAYKCPRSFTLQRDPLPLSGAGKILKADLRQRLAGRQADRI